MKLINVYYYVKKYIALLFCVSLVYPLEIMC